MDRKLDCLQRGLKSCYRSAYFSTLLEENKHNPRYLFETVAKLTKVSRKEVPKHTVKLL